MKRSFFALSIISFCLFLAPRVHAAITLIAANSATSDGPVSITSPAINTTGASLLVVICTENTSTLASLAVSDNENNAWHSLGFYAATGNSVGMQTFYAYAPTTSASHTFTCTSAAQFPSVAVSAWSGTDNTSAVFDAETGTSAATYDNSIQIGAITAASTNELFVAGFGGGTCYSATATIDYGFVPIATAGNPGCHGTPVDMAYLVTSTAATVNPTWTLTQYFTAKVANIALFRSASGSGAPDTIPPSTAITAPAPGATVSSTITVTASATDNIGVTKVEFYLDGVLQQADTVSPYAWSWNTTGALDGSHTLATKAYDAAGNVGVSANVNVTVNNGVSDATAPTVPAGLAATPISSSQINLSWTASTDPDNVQSQISYKIYRNNTFLATTVGGATSYSDTGLSASTQYAYTIAAIDPAGNASIQSSAVGATTQSVGGGNGSTGPWAGIIAPSRAIDWSYAGLPAVLPDGETTPNPWTPPSRTRCTTVNPSGKTDATDVTNITNAIAGCPAGTYVLLAPGTFTISASLYIYGHNNITVRGSGPMQTTLQMVGNNVFISLGASTGGGAGILTADSDFSPGATSVKIESVTGINTLTVGNLAWFNQCDTGYSAQNPDQPINWSSNPCNAGSHIDNGGVFVCGLDSACDLSGGSSSNFAFQQQVVRITSIANNGNGTYTIGFSPGFYMPNWSRANTATLVWEDQSYVAMGNGLEDFTLKFQTGMNEVISVGPAYASWIRGIRAIGRPANTSVYVGGRSKNSLVMNNYVFSQDPASFNSADTIAMSVGGDSDDLILNNWIQGGVGLEGGGSDVGDVIAYNYNRDSQTTYYQNSTFQHSAGSAFLLLEGNQFGVSQDDDTWGTHTFNTWFRNYFSCWDPPYRISSGGNPRTLGIGSFARFENVIGNALGSSLCQTYQSNYYSTIFYVDSRGDPLAMATLLRWGNYDTATQAVRWCGDAGSPGWSTTCNAISEVPTSLTGAASPFSNPIPNTTNLPASFFMDAVTAHPSGGTGLSWWKVCTSWNVFPASCATYATPPFPTAGPDVTGGANVNGYAYDIPAALAYQYLPIDPAFQNSYTITASSWSGGTETLTVSGLPPTANHIMGGFQIAGAPACNSPASGEFMMTGSTPTTISYALASNPGSCVGGTVKWPDVRQFDERVYQTDSSSGGASPSDTTPPMTSITSPSNGSTVSSTVSVAATASDNVGVTQVQFFLDNVLQTTDTAAPYTWQWNTALSANGSHALTVKASDAAGNTGTSPSVSVTVNNPATPPPAQTLQASLTASPSSGTSPLVVSLTASAQGTAQGTLNYIFYCNRSDTGTNVTSPADLTVTASAQNPYQAQNLCTYPTPGTYTPKVIIEQGSASPAEARQTVTVTAPSTGGSGGGTSGGSSGGSSGGGGGGSSGGSSSGGSPPTLPPQASGSGSGGSGSLTLRVQVMTLTTTTAQIRVDTSLPAMTQLFYGTVPTYGQTTNPSPSLTTSYFNLTNLYAKTPYYLRAVSLMNGQTIVATTTFTPGYGTGPQLPSASLPPFTRNLTVGSQGQDVMNLQLLLNAQGFTIAAQGAGSPGHETTYFGTLTAKAVQKFQQAHRISPVSGYVGPLTRAVLNTMLTAVQGSGSNASVPTGTGGGAGTNPANGGSITRTLTQGDQGQDVTTLQQFLQTQGYLPVTPTGYFGILTLHAVQAYQCAENIVCSGTPETTGYGSVGPRTRKAMGE